MRFNKLYKQLLEAKRKSFKIEVTINGHGNFDMKCNDIYPKFQRALSEEKFKRFLKETEAERGGSNDPEIIVRSIRDYIGKYGKPAIINVPGSKNIWKTGSKSAQEPKSKPVTDTEPELKQGEFNF